MESLPTPERKKESLPKEPLPSENIPRKQPVKAKAIPDRPEMDSEKWNSILELGKLSPESLDNEDTASLHRVLMGRDGLPLDKKYELVQVLLNAYDAKEKNLISYRRRSEKDEKYYKENLGSVHALREMYAKMLQQLQQQYLSKQSDVASITPLSEQVKYAPARLLNYLADKLQKDTGLVGFDLSRMFNNSTGSFTPYWASQHPATYATMQSLSDFLLDPETWVDGAVGLVTGKIARAMKPIANILKLNKWENIPGPVATQIIDHCVLFMKTHATDIAQSISYSFGINIGKVSSPVADKMMNSILKKAISDAERDVKTKLENEIAVLLPNIPIQIVQQILSKISLLSTI